MKHAHILPILMLATASAWAHEGHDHGPAVPEIRVEAAPRATAESEEFELVAVLEGGKLRLYLDRYASNEPGAASSVPSRTTRPPSHRTWPRQTASSARG